MANNKGNTMLLPVAIGLGVLALFGFGKKPQKEAAARMLPGGFVPRADKVPTKKRRPPPAKPKPKPLTKKQARQQKKAARNSPAAKAARAKKTGVILDFVSNMANTAASTAAEFKK